MEEENKKSNKIILIIVIIIVIICLGFFLVLKLCDNKDNNESNNNENTETPTNIDGKLVINDNIKNKLDEYINLNFTSHGVVSNSIIDGTSELSQVAKESITYNSVSNQMVQLNKDQIPEKYRNNDYWVSDGIIIYQLSLKTFEDEYKKIFNEEYKLDPEYYAIVGCPMVFNVDQELGYMFLSNQCGDTGPQRYLYLNYKYETDNDYYYVYQYIGYQKEGSEANTIEYIKPKSKEIVDVDSFSGNESKFETLIWKFDKNLLFVSTENIG